MRTSPLARTAGDACIPVTQMELFMCVRLLDMHSRTIPSPFPQQSEKPERWENSSIEEKIGVGGLASNYPQPPKLPGGF